MKYNVKYNKAIEFIISVLKYVNNKSREVHWNTTDLRKDSARDTMDFSPNSKVKDWLRYVDDNISSFFLNDLMFITDNTYRLLDVCLNLILMEDIAEPLELIESLSTLKDSTMIEFAYKYYNLETPLNNDEELRNVLTQTFSQKISHDFMQMKNNPKKYRERLIIILNTFYNDFFKPFEEDTYTYMKKRLTFHNNLFREDPMFFINTVGMGDYSKAIELHENTIIYMSFYMDVGLIYFSFEKDLIICCGQTVEHRFESRKRHDQYKSLFKALSDDKRIEILKMTSKRPWYNKELADHFNLTTATLSYHLNLLLDLNILNFEPSIINNRYYYTTNKQQLKVLFDNALNDILN